MYVLIDCTNYRAIATHADYVALSCLSYIQYANVDVVIFPTDESRPFAQFTGEQLDKIANGVLAAVEGIAKSETYTDAIGRCRAIINMARHLILPFTSDFLAEQAACIKDEDDRPFVISTILCPKPKPVQAKNWASEPQVNRARYALATSPVLTKREAAAPAPNAKKAVPLPPKAPGASLVPPPPPPAAPKAPKPATRPKAVRGPAEAREQRNGITRPKPGSKTSVPWDVADAITASKKGEVATREEVSKECAKHGCNPNMVIANYRVWRIFNGTWKK